MTSTHDDRPRVVAICGSLREDSRTRVALDATLAAARARGASTALVDLREREVPALDPDADTPADVRALQRTVADADAVMLGTPNYHGSYTGALKDALDHLGRDEFEGKTVGLLEVAGGSFPGSALAHLREVVRTLNAWTHPVEVAVPRSHATVDPDGIVDDDVAARVAELGRELVDHVQRSEPAASQRAGVVDD